MSYGYPSGMSQADHDRAFGELSTEPDDDVVRLDCGHYDTELRGEEVGGKLVCPKCFDERLKAVQAAIAPAKPNPHRGKKDQRGGQRLGRCRNPSTRQRLSVGSS